MKRIEFGAGQGLDAAYQDLQKNAPCYGEFNGRTLYSTDSLDDIYIKITRKQSRNLMNISAKNGKTTKGKRPNLRPVFPN